METETSEEEKRDVQSKRALMRMRYLSMLKAMENQRVDIQTYRGASVKATFRSVDYNMHNIHVHSLNTPIGIVPEALICTHDIVTIKFSI